MLREAEIKELENWLTTLIRTDIGPAAPTDDADLAKLAQALSYHCDIVSGDQFEGQHQVLCCGSRIVAARHRLPPMQQFRIAKPAMMT